MPEGVLVPGYQTTSHYRSHILAELMASRVTRLARAFWGALSLALFFLIPGCSNNPYRGEDATRQAWYSTISEDPKTLDPTVAYDSLSLQFVGAIYESTLQYSYLERPYKLVPALAARMPERETYTYEGDVVVTGPSGDVVRGPEGRPVTRRVRREAFSYRITLKKGLYFQDDPCFAPRGAGREVTSDDLIYAFKRLADPTLTCPVYSIIGSRIVGLEEFYLANKAMVRQLRAKGEAPRLDLSRPVKGLRKIDRYTCEVSLTEKYPQFLYWLAMPFTAPIPREAVEYYDSRLHPERDDFKDHPVGTGAYILKEYRKGHRMILERNPRFRDERYPSRGEPGDSAAALLLDAGKPLPLIDEWIYTTVKASIPRWRLFKQGYLDASSIPRETFDRVITAEGGLSEEMERRGIRLLRSRELVTYYIAFNMDDPIIGSNRKLRQAISMAIDSKEYIEIFRNNVGIVAQSPLPPGVFGYDPGYRNPYRGFDIKKARELLSQAGYPGGRDPKTGTPLTLRYDIGDTSAAGKQECRWMVKQFERLGIKLEVVINDWNTHQQKADQGNFQMIRFGWIADYPDPENFLFLLYSENRRPGVNYANYNNREYDRLFNEMKAMGNEGDEGRRRYKIIQKMIRILQEDCPWVPNFHPERYSLVHSWCYNVKLHGPANNVQKYQRVDVKLRVQKRREWNKPKNWVVWAFICFLLLASLPALRSVTRESHPC